jgi:hypothetical protein
MIADDSTRVTYRAPPAWQCKGLTFRDRFGASRCVYRKANGAALYPDFFRDPFDILVPKRG